MTYEVDQYYIFPVQSGNPSDDSFSLEVEGPEGRATVKLAKLEFQKSPEYVQPLELRCRVKSFDDEGLPVLSHCIAPYVYELYEDTFSRGGTFDCEVISVPAKPEEELYLLRDRHGIFYRYDEPEGLLSKGQIIKCKFKKLTPKYFLMMRVDEAAKMPFYEPSQIFNALGTPVLLRKFIEKHFLNSDHIASVRAELKAKNPMWLINAARIAIPMLPEWFMRAQHRRHPGVFSLFLSTLREALLYLLEGSGFLNAVAMEHRRALREQMTELVESIEPYRRTHELLVAGRQDEFVEGLLTKLQVSGYLYHPARQFAVLMLIFRLHPDKVGNYLNRIFETIFGRDLENWRREPFRSAFVEQFQIYVRQARRQIDALPLAETRERKMSLETIISAIALNLVLADANDDIRRSESLYYRYISLLRPLYTEQLLSKSFLALMGVKQNSIPNYVELKTPMMMMTRATVMPAGDFMDRLTSNHLYTNGQIDISLSSAGLQLSLTRRRDITDHVIPEGLMPWLRPQIFVSGVSGFSGSKLRKLPEHHSWWQSIENQLFNSQAPRPVQETSDKLQTPEVDSEVYIVIDGVDDASSPNPTFRCRISDIEFREGRGTLKRDQIVGYNLKYPPDTAFRDNRYNQLGFLARITAEKEDGTFEFTLRDTIDQHIRETLNYEDTYTAIIAGINDHDYSVICDNGISFLLDKDENIPCSIADVVHCRLSMISPGQIRGYITEMSEDPLETFDKNYAFVQLMHNIGVGETDTDDSEDPEANEEELVRDIDELLTPDDIREIIEIIRFKAIADTDLIKAYDYLRLGRLLALVIADQPLADKLGTHAALLGLHQYYATNSRIDADKLEAHREAASADPLLSVIFHRLELVSWLDRPERNPELYATAMNPDTELEGSIARMVLSYNMLHPNGPDIADGGIFDGNVNVSSEIKQQIMKKLNVNNETRRGKYYGSESKYLEFKTSIVYPAAAPGEEMREAPEEQQMHILSRIAGMLNAGGGRLCLGVNNDGYEVGLREDFKYYERRKGKAKVGSYITTVKDTDTLCVFIENLIHVYFGETVGRKISVSVDEEAEKGVILIDVAESLEPVYLEKRLYVRQCGQSTREYHGTAIDEFEKERAELRAERAHLLSISSRGDETDTPETTPEAASEESGGTTETAADDTTEIRSDDAPAVTLETSRWRPNVLYNYEAGFVEPLGYLFFKDNGQFMFSTNAYQMYPGTDGCLMALIVPHEMEDGYLILGFDNERVTRISIAEIISKGENKAIDINDEYPLMFAALANEDDGLLCIATDGKDTYHRRVNRVGTLAEGSAKSHPRRIHDTTTGRTVLYEIVGAAAMHHFADSTAEAVGTKRFGVTMRVKPGSPYLETKIADTIKDCNPEND